MGQPYTYAVWGFKAGEEGEFVRRWTGFADWTGWEGLAAAAKLLRDTEDPSGCVSFGPWESLDAIRRWRHEPGFHERVARLHEVLESFEPSTLELIVDR